MTPFAIPECKSCKLRYRCFLYRMTKAETMILFQYRLGPTIEAFMVERLSNHAGRFDTGNDYFKEKDRLLPCVILNALDEPCLDYDMFVNYFRERVLWPMG